MANHPADPARDDLAGRAPAASPGAPTLTLYGRPGCGLCAETRTVLISLLEARRSAGLPVAVLVDRDIESDPELERRYLVEIPVIELGERRLTLAISPARIERLLVEVLDG